MRIGAFGIAMILLVVGCSDAHESTTRRRGMRTAQGRVTGTGASGLRVREEPSAASTQIGTVDEGESVLIYCQVAGQSVDGNSAWNLIEWNGREGYVADAYIDKGGKGFTNSLDRCDEPASSTGETGAPRETNSSGPVDIEGPTVRAHVQVFANEACAAVNACDASTYDGHQPSAELALDFLISEEFGRTPTDNYAFGERLAEFALENLTKYRIEYVIFRQRINHGDGWRSMEDRGSITQNHYDHVHVSFDP